MTTLRLNRHLLTFGHDVFMAAAAFMIALTLRMSGDLSLLPTADIVFSVGLFTGVAALVFATSGLYRSVWAFTSLSDLLHILKAVSLSVILFVLTGFLITRLEGVPRTVPFISWFILLSALGGSRLMFRLLRERRLSALWENSGSGRVHILLVGAGDEADIFMRAISANPQTPYHVVGIIGENQKRVGRRIHGVEVMGTVEDLPSIIERLKETYHVPSRLVLTRAVGRFNGALVSQLLEQSAHLGLSLSRLPAMTELRDDITLAATMRDQPLMLEDLLGRPETKLNQNEIRSLIAGRRVIITGAGGSIGSELTRQIAALRPSRLILIDSSEFNLYRIDTEIREANSDLALKAYLADVRDGARLDHIFEEELPELVFHAAAIKHVPIAEDNGREAILTNALGTRLVADCAARCRAQAMVLISTDKAVHPSSVMGATKRLAEMYCQALDLASETTRFITVRFGNVLGSTGSVVPRFQEQIGKGGPITVTHPDITRYFMTAREAVELVLQASALGIKPGDQRGKVLVLDMGQPVKIVDLARQMIRLAGLRPEEDIKIVFTGLRPGEKMHEELFSESEALIPSSADGVKLARATTIGLSFLKDSLQSMEHKLRVDAEDVTAIVDLANLIPEYRAATNQKLPPAFRITGSA